MPNNAMVEEMNKSHFIDVSRLLSNQGANIDFYLFVAISNRVCTFTWWSPNSIRAPTEPDVKQACNCFRNNQFLCEQLSCAPKNFIIPVKHVIHKDKVMQQL